jgi:hypothetical protein
MNTEKSVIKAVTFDLWERALAVVSLLRNLSGNANRLSPTRL